MILKILPTRHHILEKNPDFMVKELKHSFPFQKILKGKGITGLFMLIENFLKSICIL